MIFCKLEQLGRYRGLSQHLDTAIRFLEEGGASRLKEADLTKLVMGRNEVDGEAVYVNRFAYDTAAEAITEGHIRYVDVHLVLSGQEQIGVADVSTLEEIERREEEDCILFSGPFQSLCVMKPGDVLITFPEDAHSPKRQNGAPCHVEKAVIKVLWD